jgi:hypothetical protein
MESTCSLRERAATATFSDKKITQQAMTHQTAISFSRSFQHQFNSAGELTHLLTLEGLPREQILHILDTAQQFVSVTDPAREVKKVPLLRGKSVFNLFFENSFFFT